MTLSVTEPWSYEYNAFGDLTHVAAPDGKMIEYVVDGMQRRIGKKVNGNFVEGYVYKNELQIVADVDGSGQLRNHFVYASDRRMPDYFIRDGQRYRMLTDHLGSVRLVVDAQTGAVAQRLDYDEFGAVLLDTNPGFQPFGFAGGLYDPDTGLVRFGARNYAPYTGRWTAKDPILFNGGDTNLYGYVLNDPVNGIDPEGLRTYSLGFAGGGALFGFGGQVNLAANFGIADDGRLSSSVTFIASGGAAAGLGATVALYGGSTDAQTVKELTGAGYFFGRSGLAAGSIGVTQNEDGTVTGAEGTVGPVVGFYAAGTGKSQTWELFGGDWYGIRFGGEK